MTLERIVNADTGETGTFVPDGENYQITSEQQREASRAFFDRQRRVDYGRNTDFTFAAMEALGEVISALTTAQCGFLAVLQCYVSYAGNTLVNPNKSPMTTADMMAALKLEAKRSTFYAFLSACVGSGIMAEEDGVYAINPRYHFRGQAKDTQVIRTYTAKIKQAYTDASKAADLGLIYRMLPFVSYETNALCSNPTERNPLKVDWFSGKELADAISMAEAELSRRIKRLTIGDEYVIARISVGGTAKYMFNPLIFKRNKRPVPEEIQAMFNVKYRSRRKRN